MLNFKGSAGTRWSFARTKNCTRASAYRLEKEAQTEALVGFNVLITTEVARNMVWRNMEAAVVLHRHVSSEAKKPESVPRWVISAGRRRSESQRKIR